MKKFLMGLRYGNWWTKLYVISVPVCYLGGIGFIIAAFLTNKIYLFLIGVVIEIIAVLLNFGFTIDVADGTGKSKRKAKQPKNVKEKKQRKQKAKKQTVELNGVETAAAEIKTTEPMTAKGEHLQSKTVREKKAQTVVEEPKPERHKQESNDSKPEKNSQENKGSKPVKESKVKVAEQTGKESKTEAIKPATEDLKLDKDKLLMKESEQEEAKLVTKDVKDKKAKKAPKKRTSEQIMKASKPEASEQTAEESKVKRKRQTAKEVEPDEPKQTPKVEKDDFLSYDEAKLKQVFYKYKVRKDHRTIIIDEWKEKEVYQSPAYIWVQRGQIHFLILGESTQEITIPESKAATMSYHRGVVCQAKNEYLQFRKESLLKQVFSPYLPVYHEGNKNGRPVIYKNLFEIGEGTRITNTSAKVIMDMFQPEIQVDDIVTRDLRYNAFYKEIYKHGILFREKLITAKGYQDRINESLQNLAHSDVLEREYEDTLQLLFQKNLISQEYVTYYQQYRKRIQEEELQKASEQGNRRKKTKKIRK